MAELYRITGYVKNYKVGDVRDALVQIGVDNLTYDEMRLAVMDPTARKENGAISKIDFIPQARLEVLVEGERTRDLVVLAITSAARTRKTEEGLVYWSKVEGAIRVIDGSLYHTQPVPQK